ncbi:helix-turn-helix domain-containing protein [Paenibacillus sp. NPDC058071]|uniref:helix-turn-helix domain-containing protein n=1 Tax=Paenibacillus sp. NPDC058071 TaxID=3346326 RepID=UPI0036DE8C44
MNPTTEDKALSDLLQSLHMELLVAAYTQVSMQWGETDSIRSYNKLYYIVDGEGWIKVGQEHLHPKPGQLCIVPAGMQHSFSPINDKPFLKYWCHFTLTAGPLDLFQWIGVPLCIDIEDAERMTRLFQEMVHWNGQSSVIARLREKLVLLEIVSAFLELVPVKALQQRTEEMNRLSVIQHYVEAHLDQTISTRMLADAVHLHPNYFIAYFKKHFGMPPLKYVGRKRIERAKLLLTTTTLSVKEIAVRTGFSETNHFTKFFRKDTGYSPTDFRTVYTAKSPADAQ